MPRITSLVKKNFPSDGTIMICSLSDKRSAIILLISSGFCFSTIPSFFIRSASATAVIRMRSASACASNLRRSISALLSIILAWPAASAPATVVSFRASASSLDCSICFCFRDLHLLLMNFSFHAHAVVFLFLQQQRFQSLGILFWKLDVAQHHFFYDDSVRGQALADHLRRLFADFFALAGKHFADGIGRHEFTPSRCDHWRHDFLLQRLWQIRLNEIKMVRIHLIPHRDRQSQRQPFFRLHV